MNLTDKTHSKSIQINYFNKLLTKQTYYAYLYLHDLVTTIQQYIHIKTIPQSIVNEFIIILKEKQDYLYTDSIQLSSTYTNRVQNLLKMLITMGEENQYWNKLLTLYKIDNLQGP